MLRISAKGQSSPPCMRTGRRHPSTRADWKHGLHDTINHTNYLDVFCITEFTYCRITESCKFVIIFIHFDIKSQINFRKILKTNTCFWICGSVTCDIKDNVCAFTRLKSSILKNLFDVINKLFVFTDN